ncbi:MAG: glutamate formimidoyltransferase [bacterium]|nr:glutamate formimidoyltransferase [bacterium]
MRAIVECVPNYSEGKNSETIQAISDAISSVPNVALLNVEPDADYNRVVVTFAGEPFAVVEAAIRGHRVAAERIDMTTHKGNHPRMGAADVVPFIPIRGITMEECVKLSELYAERVWAELGIPCYLYEYAARTPERKNLAKIRSGEYEGLPEKLKDPNWLPDVGDPIFVPKSGATVTGARFFLIAYNVNINHTDVSHATDIAYTIRSLGKPVLDAEGKQVVDEKGKKKFIPGRLKEIKAMGVPLERNGRKLTQVSVNVINYRVTPVHVVYDEVVKEASAKGLDVTGSEIVGLIPQEALVEAGKHYAKQKNLEIQNEDDFLELGATYLGLSDLSPFIIEEKVIEKIVAQKLSLSEKALTIQTLSEFSTNVASESPAPGGGSVAANSSALGVSLLEMVCSLTIGKKKFENVWEQLSKVRTELALNRYELLAAVERDTIAFNQIMKAMKLPKTTDEEKAIRKSALQKATLKATEVPLKVMQVSLEALKQAPLIAQLGNPNALSDVGVGAEMLLSGVRGAYFNVLINLSGLTEDHQKTFREHSKEIAEQAEQIAQTTIKEIENKLMNG